MSPKARTLWLIFLVCAAPIVLGTLAYRYHWGTPATANYGELVPARPLSGAAFKPLRGKWVLVTFDPAACPAECEKKLYVVRQVRRALGADAERIERLWVVTDSGKPRADVLAAIEGSQVQPVHEAGEMSAFAGNPLRHIYVVDPLGNLMMRYPEDPDPGKIIKDLERLLKVSRIG